MDDVKTIDMSKEEQLEMMNEEAGKYVNIPTALPYEVDFSTGYGVAVISPILVLPSGDFDDRLEWIKIECQEPTDANGNPYKE